MHVPIPQFELQNIVTLGHMGGHEIAFTDSALFMAITVVGIWAMIASIGAPEASTGTWLLAVAPSLVGIQLLVQALVLDIQATPQ